MEATVGGTRRHLLSLISGLDREKYEIDVAAPMVRKSAIDDRSFVNELKNLNVQYHRVDMVREIRPVDDVFSLITLAKLIKNNHYDIVHTHSSKAGFIGRLAAKLQGIPTIYTPNGFYFLDANNQTKQLLFLMLERLAGFLTDKLIAVSESEKKQAIYHKIVSPEKVVLIPNSIDVNCFRQNKSLGLQVRKELGILESVPVVGTVSRYISQKDPFTLIRTFAYVKSVISDACLIWCGEGELRDRTEALARELGVFDAVFFLGYRDDARKIMNAFDVFILTSLFEGLPYTLLEAMALGLPVVATDVVGSHDVVQNGETGMLIPLDGKQVIGLGKAVISFLKKKNKRTTFGERGRAVVEENYNLSQMIVKTENLYFLLLNKNEK